MKKDIEWLKAQIYTEMMYLEHIRKERWSGVKYQTLRSVYQKINQLDETEVLSQEWVDENSTNLPMSSPMTRWVPASKLQNLLIPKQEITKVPQGWFDVIKRNKDMTLETILRIANPKREEEERFVKAWLAYPDIEVEEEQKYFVNILDEGIGAYLIYYPKSGNYGVTGVLDDSKGITRFTEQEIKDYDERYWAFAVEVAE